MDLARTLLALTVVAALPAAATPDAHPQLVVRSGVDLVRVTTTVTDSAGRFIPGLVQDDFTVLDDGQPQPILSFSAERVPVSLGIVLDTSLSMDTKLATANAAVKRFTNDLLGSDDELFLAAFHQKTWLHQTWTTDRTLLNAALAKTSIGAGTSLYDAIQLTLPIAAAGRHPKKALLVLSDGDDTSSDIRLPTLQALIRASDVLIYALAMKGDDNVLKEKNLRTITDDTGGRTEIVRSPRNLAAATAKIADELNQQYLIGYAMPHASDREWHSIQVKVRQRGARVRARAGYLAGR